MTTKQGPPSQRGSLTRKECVGFWQNPDEVQLPQEY